MTRRSTALPKSKKYIGLHAVRRAFVHLCEDRTASSEAVRDDRHGSAVPELRVQTGVLNEILTEAMAMQQPPSDRGKRLKIYYMTQVSVKPPTFVIFVNDKD